MAKILRGAVGIDIGKNSFHVVGLDRLIGLISGDR